MGVSDQQDYQSRPIIQISLLDHNVEILNPEAVVLKLKSNTKASDTYFDIGSLCYKHRRSRFAGRITHIDQLSKPTEVVLSSKEEWRVTLIAALIEHFRAQVITKTLDTTRGIIKTLIKFIEYCETFPDVSRRVQSFEGVLSIYRDYTDILRHRNKLSPNNTQSMTKASAASIQRNVRGFIKFYFNKTEIDIIRYVPSIGRGKDKASVVSAPDSHKRDDFIKFASALFQGLADGIMNQDYAPIKLSLPVGNHMLSVIYSDPRMNKNVVLNDDLTWPAFHEKINITDECWVKADANSRRLIRLATHQAKEYRSLITPSYSLSKAYVLAQSAFIACFYAATGINASPLTNLKTTSDVAKTLRGMRFSGLKARAGNKTIYPEFGAHFLSLFTKFKTLRAYIISLFGDVDLWFFRPMSHVVKLDADSTLIPLKNFIKDNDIDLQMLTPTQIRKGVAIDFLKLSSGDLFITSQKLGNTISTVVTNYTKNTSLEQSKEFSDFYQKMFHSALERARPYGVDIGVLEAAQHDFTTPAGHCSNSHHHIPERMEGFTDDAPKPDCARPETCLFCKHYSIMADREDIAKLLGLKQLIKLVRGHVGTSDRYISILSPVYYRINEIIGVMATSHPQTKSIITDVNKDIDQGILHPFWEEHYAFLIELGT
jgi:hypothetical protein